MNRFLIASISLLIFCFAAVAPGSAEPSAEEQDQALHALNRLTYGPRPGDVQAVAKMGVKRFIYEQLHPESLKIPQELSHLIAGKPELTMSPQEMFAQFGRPALKAAAEQNPVSADPEKDAMQLIRQTYRKLYLDQFQARLNRALDSPRQLEELMTEFWFNHFNVAMQKGLDNIWTGSYEQTAIRPFALGKFRDLLGATAHHAAMLFYLDNWENSKPEQAAFKGNKRFRGINENYARELMELHTLGVDGPYTQKDVIELARILTGLGLPPRRHREMTGGSTRYGDYFNPARHDFADKIFLGHVIKGSGEHEIEEALDLLAAHPATAHHVCYQIAQYFVCDNPPPALVEKMSGAFLATGGDITAVLAKLFSSPEFWDKKYRDCKFKSPYRYVVSAMRATNTDATNVPPVLNFLARQGMAPYRWLTPDGYKNTEQSWLNSDALLNRLNFATALGTGRLPDLKMDIAGYQEVEQLLGKSASVATLRAISRAPEQLKVSLVLGSPEFMKY